ncbi:MAG TPA: hypothetical protein VGL15_05560 [Vicinamibacteria bacterium]
MRDTARVLSICLIASIAVVFATGPASAAKPLEQLTAFAVDMSNMSGGARTGTVDITIDRWTTDEERDRLRAALQEGGSDGLLRALQKEKEVGRIRSTGSIGYPLRFAREIPISTGGRRILLGTDRPVSFLERTNPGPTSQYPFMVIDIRLNAKGEGEGKLLPLAKVTMDEDHVVEIENYASEPVRLTSVRKLK